jgi:hypothetical protein
LPQNTDSVQGACSPEVVWQRRKTKAISTPARVTPPIHATTVHGSSTTVPYEFAETSDDLLRPFQHTPIDLVWDSESDTDADADSTTPGYGCACTSQCSDRVSNGLGIHMNARKFTAAQRHDAVLAALFSTVHPNCTATFMIRGVVVCKRFFCYCWGISLRTCTRILGQLSGGPFPPNVEAPKRPGRKRTQEAINFLQLYAELYGSLRPTFRAIKKTKHIWVLPDFTKKPVYDEYVSKLHSPDIGQGNPLSWKAFLSVWKKHASHIKLATSGSDYCDTCTTLQNPVYSGLLQYHKAEASLEREAYNERMSGTRAHFVFDFAEKILLPHLTKQPGAMFFAKRLKYDVFGVYECSQSSQSIFGLAEGHWPDRKTANEVLSMLHAVLQADHNLGLRDLSFTADNCGGQNKNRWILQYMCWRILSGLSDHIELHFMIAGHTKCVCDQRFGSIKSKLKITDVWTPTEMSSCIASATKDIKIIEAPSVRWQNWKTLLNDIFDQKEVTRITSFQSFQFSRSYLGQLQCRVNSMDELHPPEYMWRYPKSISEVKTITEAWNQSSKSTDGMAPRMTEARQQGLITDVLRFLSNHDDRRIEYFKQGGEDPLICHSPDVPDDEGEAGADGMDASSTSEDVDDDDVEGDENAARTSLEDPIAVETTRKRKTSKAPHCRKCHMPMKGHKKCIDSV